MKYYKPSGFKIISVLLFFSIFTLAKATDLAYALTLKGLAEDLKAENNFSEAAQHYDLAVDYGLGFEYGLWNSIDLYIKSEMPSKALNVMKRLASSGNTDIGFFEMYGKSFNGVLKKQHDELLERIKNNKKQNPPKQVEGGHFYTEDVENFFIAFDKAKNVTDEGEKIKIYADLYFNKASSGMVDYATLKIKSLESFVKYIESNRVFYEGVRQANQRIKSLIPLAQNAMKKIRSFQPENSDPDIYFVVGMHTSGGTISKSGILLGADFITDNQSRQNGIKEWVYPHLSNAEERVWIIIHEYMHTLQNTQHDNVLGAVLVEGGADFLTNLLYEKPKKEKLYTTYGLSHEKRIAKAFKEQMYNSDLSLWTGNNGKNLPEDWVADLGYFIGHQIVKAYYEKADNKNEAINNLLILENPQKILEVSGYLDQFDFND